jgi:Domain of unknown function (DUF4398)
MKWKIRVVTVVAALGACASIPRPSDELTQSESALRSAQELGAAQIPQAALELKLAQDELQKAQELMKNDRNDDARQSLLRSRADAELALALTRQGQANRAAEGAREELRAVQKSVQ